ncbi:unnamed protein product [Urochloa decumbens]|uniref:Uncharacterized protein n=1 Tax=Urochloa decumbens TaxID=240449 RepID=A0ABC9CXE1_9POAL
MASADERRTTATETARGGVFAFADRVDAALMALGTLGAVADGCSYNLLLVFASDVVNSLGRARAAAQFMHEVDKSCLNYVYLALAVLPVAFLEGYCWSRTSERQVRRIRRLYLQAMLRQESAFFDSGDAAAASEIIGGISKDASLIQEVLAEKVPLFLMHSTAFISGLAFSIYFSWRLALAASPLALLLVIPGLIYGKYLLRLSHKSRHEYAKVNFVVEQALSSIKTIYSFTAEKRIIHRYATVLDGTIKLGIKQGIAKGLAVGCNGIGFAVWAFLAWYGSRSLGVALPELKHLTEASIAATRILERINRVPQINSDDPEGLMLDRLWGGIKFESVHFAYPSRPHMTVLHDFNLHIPAGKTVALVGSSGSGKSTAIALVQRFYDASEGTVKIDGVDIKELQLKWIRSKMGLVSQDHALFGTSIKENILFGKPVASTDEIYAAAMTANAHDFIMGLPEEYDTKVGERGALLSGGQKQRIAIARAVIRNPVILLLDEATSALDSESEKLVQDALHKASIGRTTLHYNFAYMGVHLVRRIQIQVLEKILTFDAAWFDEETNSSGSLCSRLSNEASLVKTLVADRISLLLQTASGIVTAVTMGLILAWKLALVMIAVQPSTIICYYAKKTVLTNVSRDLAKAQHQSTQIAIEAVYNHRMITSFACSSKVIQLFEHAQAEPQKKGRKMSWVAGITTGMSPCLLYLSWALDYWYGGKLVQSGEISAADFFKTFFVLMTTGKLIAEAGSMTSDLAKGANAVASVFEVLDRKSPQNLQDFSFDVKAGSSVGLVGKSGCGKSTIIGLIQRFYDVGIGAVCIDGMDVRDINIRWYRGQTSLVSQEPVIFSCSVRNNITFGKPEADEDEIVEAAKAANAHEFISSLKDGYETDCGEHGIQFSEGQKQRIAIARAIIRNPAILLLDEATSALDAQSEKMVQEALDRIMSGRTTIVVAHRLNTIRSLDSIAVLGEGKLVELGTYPQLMNMKGAFYNLATLQK